MQDEYDSEFDERPSPSPPPRIDHLFWNLDSIFIDVEEWEDVGKLLNKVHLEKCPATSLVLSTTSKLKGDLSVLTRFTKLKNLETLELFNVVWADRNRRSEAEPVSICKVYSVLEMLLPCCPNLKRILFREANSDRKIIDSLLLDAADLQTYRDHMSKNKGSISYSFVAPVSARGQKVETIKPKELERDSESECEISVEEEENFPTFYNPALAYLLSNIG
jgi:hypothetical protein